MTRFDDDLDDFFGRPSTLRPGPATGPKPGGRATVSVVAAAPPEPHLRRSRPVTRPRSARPPRRSRSRSARQQPLAGAEIRTRTLRRLLALAVTVTLLVTGIVVRLVDISHGGGSACRTTGVTDCRTYGVSQRTAYRPLPAGRGTIYDRNGQAFAMSVPEPNVVADPRSVLDPVATARILAPILGADEAVLSKQLSDRSRRYAMLAPAVAPAVKDRVEAAITEDGLLGIDFEEQFVRKDPAEGLARAVIGRTYDRGLVDDRGRQGQNGLELRYDDALRGTPGRMRFEKDRDGGTIAGTREKVDAAVPGTDLYLTLDQSLQYSAERAVIDQVTKTGARQGMAVISRPSTGEVLAMVSVADDGHGRVANTGDNRPVSTVFEPGSVNKMITVAGAMEDGVVDPDTVLDVPDHLQVADHRFSDHDAHPVEPWSVTDILVTSSNIGTIKIAQELGASRLDHYLRSFGFGNRTGSDFPGEVAGLLLPLDDWSGTSIGSIPIGQGISVTGLQMLAAYNVVANDGVAAAPRLLAARDDGSGKQGVSPSPQRRVLSTHTARAMSAMLTKVVADGTGKPAQIPGYPVAGKTGTARIPQPSPHPDPTDAYRDAEGRYHYESSFVGFVPGADLSVIVTIQDAKTSIYGSEVAAPVFATLASLALRNESIAPPALTDAQRPAVPDLSPSARRMDGEDPGLVTRARPG